MAETGVQMIIRPHDIMRITSVDMGIRRQAEHDPEYIADIRSDMPVNKIAKKWGCSKPTVTAHRKLYRDDDDE